ncbi:MAG TPA: hypothetical protein VII34_10010 [Pyrinomonadaceae bacterium]
MTRLKSDRLVLINSPDQFLEFQLIAAWSGERRLGAPQRIYIELISHTLKPTYQGQDRRLFVVADESMNDLGPLSFSGIFYQASGDPPGIYDLPDSTLARVPIPLTAVVLAANPSALLTAEVLHTQDIRSEQIANMARTKTLALKLESALVDLTEDQMAIVRAFERNLMPPPRDPKVSGAAMSKEQGLTDNFALPIDITSSSLELTLNWLKKQLETNGRVDAISGDLARTEIEEASGCRVTFRASSLNEVRQDDFAILGPSTYYIVDLAELNPASATITKSSLSATVGFVTVRFATHDNKRTVLVIVRKAVTGKEYNRRLDYSLNINFRSDAPVFQIRNAMARAIRLCHTPR